MFPHRVEDFLLCVCLPATGLGLLKLRLVFEAADEAFAVVSLMSQRWLNYHIYNIELWERRPTASTLNLTQDPAVGALN